MTSNLLFTKQQTLNLCLRLKVGWTTKRVQHPRRGSCLVASPSAVQICSIRPYTWPCYRSTWSTHIYFLLLSIFFCHLLSATSPLLSKFAFEPRCETRGSAENRTHELCAHGLQSCCALLYHWATWRRDQFVFYGI